jgi:biopolymer transport protein ExbB|nr:MotA/TolQ/ExbB proton channel family protein [Candidatus Krumholzibacteria bacterium]
MGDWVFETMEYLEQGGWVMFPLALCSLAMWLLILDRFLVFRRFSNRSLDLATVLHRVRGGGNGKPLHGLRGELFGQFLKERFGDPEVDRHVLKQIQESLRGALRSRLAVIAVLAGIAPLLGLLGTVLGMIHTFEVISLFGTGNARAMAGGISMALVTTQAGLLVAIPGLFISGFLARRARRLENSLDEFSHQLDRLLTQPTSYPTHPSNAYLEAESA